MTIPVWLVPDTARAGEAICSFRGPIVVHEDKAGDGRHAYHPAYAYHCRTESGGYVDHLQFSDMPNFSDARFADATSARIWLDRHHDALAPVRGSFATGAGKVRDRRGSLSGTGRMIDIEVIGASAFQLGIVSLTLLPQTRILRVLKWMLDAPDIRGLKRSPRPGRVARR